MTKRTFLLFGAAFLVTVAAALFAPVLLPLAVIPCAFLLVFPLLPTRRPAWAMALGCLAALAVCGCYAPRLQRLRQLEGSKQPFCGVLLPQQQRQLAFGALGDGRSVLVELFPPVEAAPGDWVSGDLLVKRAAPGSLCYPLSGGVLLSGSLPEWVPAPAGVTHPYLRLLQQRDALAQQLLSRSPSTGTAVTLSLLFSYRQALPPALSAAFSRSGLGHLMAVSGLHLSILVWWAVALLRRLHAGRGAQFLVGVCCILPVLLASGVSPSAFRASVMMLLTLLAMVLNRRSDPLTSLTLAAVLLTVLCPPILTDLSFLLSFLASLGILLFAPAITALLRRLSLSGGIAESVAVSLAAQLTTALPAALVFGQLPLLGALVNLVAIPLVYPVLIFGFAGALCTGLGLAAPAGVLLFISNLFSTLIALLATFFAKIPFASLPVLFPGELVAAAVLSAALFVLLLLPPGNRFLPYRIAAATGMALVLVIVPLRSYRCISVISSTRSGSLIIASPRGRCW
ncbi:MAG: ComEC/Rec2 family competence protein [Angelakisella sp.]